MSEIKRKPVEVNGRTFYLSSIQRKFKAAKIRLTQTVTVYSMLGVETLNPGTVLKLSPLYNGVPQTAISGDGKEVHVSLGQNSSCWIPEGRWEIHTKS
jgi:hypothetical protein